MANATSRNSKDKFQLRIINLIKYLRQVCACNTCLLCTRNKLFTIWTIQTFNFAKFHVEKFANDLTAIKEINKLCILGYGRRWLVLNSFPSWHPLKKNFRTLQKLCFQKSYCTISPSFLAGHHWFGEKQTGGMVGMSYSYAVGAFFRPCSSTSHIHSFLTAFFCICALFHSFVLMCKCWPHFL